MVLKDYAIGRGKDRESGRRIKYKNTAFDTPEAERLEADVSELDEILARFNISGGEPNGYTRVFNNLSWRTGGRLYSGGQDSYQRLPEAQRLKMTINGEPVVEIDIKASHLTIYHAMAREPLKGASDPYARAGIRSVDRQAVDPVSFGNSKPATRWPGKMVKDFRKDTGKDLASGEG